MRNVWILTVAQAFAACGMVILVAFGGIVGARIAPATAFATLPLACAVVGVALATLPAAHVSQRFGRKRAFIGGALVGAVGALLCAWATARASFAGFCTGAAILGAFAAFVMQFRFAATEHVGPEQAGRAIALVMLGTLAAAVVGPALADAARNLFDWPEFTGSFVALAGLAIVAAAILATLQPTRTAISASREAARPLRAIAAQPAFLVAVLAGVASYAVMSFVMTATPISMHVIDRLSVSDTGRVISAHVLAMYLPSLASGWLTRAVGLKAMMLLGVGAMGACIAIAVLVDHHFPHYLSGLVLLGAGWNLLFVAGTTLLTRTYTPAERFRVQGVNDFVVFATQALASLLAGSAIVAWGWAALNLAALPLLAVMAGSVWWWHRREQRGAESAAAPAISPAGTPGSGR